MHLRVLSALLVSVLCAGCIHIYEPRPSTSPAKASAAAAKKKPDDKEKSRFKPWDKTLEDSTKHEGMLTAHLKRDQTLMLELSDADLDRDFGLVMHYSQGLGDLNVHDGLILARTRMVRFKRVGDTIYLVHRNPRFTADEGTPMYESVQGNVGHSILAALPIVSQHEESKNVVVDFTKFLTSDYGGVGERLKPYFDKKPVAVDAKRSYLSGIKDFEKNVEIDVMLTFRSSSAPRGGGHGVADFRSIPVGVRYSLFELPAEPMRPRFADDRVGHFLTVMKDFSQDKEETFYKRYVNRWRLEKKDPSAEMSEPVKPIVYYVDSSVPHEYRQYVKEGIELWNRAFEKAGFKNAVVAKMPPEDDPDWDAEDIRYSTIRWTAAHRMGYAIGPSQVDPRTGEILNADILISSTFIRGWLYHYQTKGPEVIAQELMQSRNLMAEMDPEMLQHTCFAQLGKAHQMAVGYTMMAALGRISPDGSVPEEYMAEAIRDLIMHEVGHTLGLRHNFRASAAIPNDKLHDKSFTGKHGVSVSVMDYNPVNIAADESKQGHYWNTVVGDYDIWAIQYAYAPVYEQSESGDFAMSGTLITDAKEELTGLRKLASLSADPLKTYGTDEDNWLGPYAVDPHTSAWDLSADPIAYARERSRLVKRIEPQLEDRLIEHGEGYQQLRGAYAGLTSERLNALMPAVRCVGGLYVARDHKGDPNERLPFTPISAARQRDAVRVIVEGALSEDAFSIEPGLLNKLAVNRWTHWGVNRTSPQLEFPMHDYVRAAHAAILSNLFNPVRLRRMVDNELRSPHDNYSVAEMMETLTSSIWSELGTGSWDTGKARTIDSFRRNLQRIHIDLLSGMLLDVKPPSASSMPEDARSMARWSLSQVSDRLGRLGSASGLDTATRAHLMESKARIDRALEASLSLSVAIK